MNNKCNECKRGKRGKQGLQGIPGKQGIQGIPGTMNISNFYSLMQYDNSSKIAIGDAINFDKDGPANNSNIKRLSPSTFNLELVGIYEIIFQVNIKEAAQLVIVINGNELDYTVIGKAIGTNQILGDCLILTTIPNSVLSINNPIGSNKEIIIETYNNGNISVSANLIIKRYD
jgi:hypothetical protein